MSVKKETTINTKLTAKGVLLGIDDAGFHVNDEKSGDTEVLSMDDIRGLLLGKSVSITFANKEVDTDEE